TNCAPGASSYVLTRGWDYSGITGFVVTNANGDKQTFNFWSNEYADGTGYCAFQHGLRLSSWSFPYGVTINLAYQPNALTGLDELYEVSNTLGRKIYFSTSGFAGFDNELTGTDARSVVVSDSPLSL